MHNVTGIARAVWHDNHLNRVVRGDPCAPLRSYLLQLEEFLQAIENDQPGLLESQFEDNALLRGMTFGYFELRNCFILLNQNTIMPFVRSAENYFNLILTEHLAAPWQKFLEGLSRRANYNAVEDLRRCIDRIVRRLANPACPSALSEAYREHVKLNWENVRAVLIFGELVPMDAVWHFLNSSLDLIMDQRKQHGLPIEPGWWTDTSDGEFTRLSQAEIAERTNDRAINSSSDRSRVITGSIDDIIDEMFFCAPEEDVVHLVDIKHESNILCHQISWNAIKYIERFTFGRIEETRLVEVLVHVLTAATRLAEMHKESLNRKKFVSVRLQAVEEITKQKENRDAWILKAAKLILKHEPRTTKKRISEILISETERKEFSDKYGFPEAQSFLDGVPGNGLEKETILRKLYKADKAGIL